MNVLPTLTSLPYYGILITIASLFGVCSYYAISSIQNRNSLLIGFWIFMMASAIASFAQTNVGWGIVGFAVVVAIVGSLAQASHSPKAEPFWFRLWRMLLSMFFSLFLGGFILCIFLSVSGRSTGEGDPVLWIYCYGLLVSPIIPPLFLCLLKASKLRPGIDCHFKQRGENKGKPV